MKALQRRRTFAVLGVAVLVIDIFAVHRVTRTSAAETTTPCGPVITKSNGQPWQCTFAEDFNGTSLDKAKWQIEKGHPNGDPDKAWSCQVRDPQNIAVSGGALSLTTRKLDKPVWCARMGQETLYTSGSVSTYHRFSQAYGRYEIRAMAAPTTEPGLQESYWLWPDDRYVKMNWPTTGEIDIVETYSSRPTLAIPYLHYTSNDNDGAHLGVNTARDCPAERGVWNTYDMVWTPSQITVSVNGQVCLVNTSADPAFANRYILMLTSALGGAANALTSDSVLPATTYIDYVRVWK